MQPAIRDYYSIEELWGGQTQRRIAARRLIDLPVRPDPDACFRGVARRGPQQ
jgi:hypothetical protein